MDKVVASAREAIAGLENGMRVAVGGFGLCGIPQVLIDEVHAAGVEDLEVVSNNCGVDGWGLGVLLDAGRLRRVIASYVGENKEFARQYLQGELEVELTPQGTLAEKLRAAGAGLAGFWTRTGVGTLIAEGGMPWRHDAEGNVTVESPAKETREFTMLDETHEYVLEESLPCDFALVRAAVADRHGNLVFNKSAQNFNPVAAMAGRVCVAEVEQLVEPGEIDPDEVDLPGVYVQRLLVLTEEQAAEKRIEKRTVTESKEA
ncbi:3-oxoacid CoA-transferase subunit A [Kytococcus aerolatus]|uniref:3-oxoacid CoA-transferase subunit A n=1 Tax=Kytococcus aerolatus TaxID=592308 RepID=A0A212U001_9MICO|nr:CoA transferase subunit A [Kytococcus aerolatus]SNC71456.1 3-oxoacid CoA-transferase subunit A [Kytococcus aerolatus]